MTDYQADYEDIVQYLRGFKRILVAFSGGVDSTLLLAAAVDSRKRDDSTGENNEISVVSGYSGAEDSNYILAVTAVSPSFTDEELNLSKSIAESLGVEHLIVQSREFEDEKFIANDSKRCYWCKKSRYTEMINIGSSRGIDAILDGSNHDDRKDYRPGAQAASELKIISPFAILCINKKDIRQMARLRNLPNWNLPACACLASRIPYGTRITSEKLRNIEIAEAKLKRLGFSMIRLRDHGEIARIEIVQNEIENAVKTPVREKMAEICREHGFRYTCLDIMGYRTGSLNEGLEATNTGVEEDK